MRSSENIHRFEESARAVLTGRENHTKNGQSCTILRALPNPSGRLENQWYDVRFDDNIPGRFVGKHLAPANAEQVNPQATNPAA